jgi:ribosomal protein S12
VRYHIIRGSLDTQGVSADAGPSKYAQSPRKPQKVIPEQARDLPIPLS